MADGGADNVVQPEGPQQEGTERPESRASSRAEAAAEKQALMVKAKYAKMQTELELRKLQLESEMQQLQLAALIEAAAAKETVFTAFEDGQDALSQAAGPTVDNLVSTVSQRPVEVRSELNPMAGAYIDQTVPAPGANDNVVQLQNSVGERSDGLNELVATLRLPQTQLPKFDGDPLKYWLFIRAFDHCVGDMPVDPAAKLNRLLQYCVGKALKVIEGCAVMEPSSGYVKARQLLKERFGNDYVISDAWVRRIVDGPAVKAYDRSGIRELADDVRLCMETLDAMNMLNEIDTRDKMVKVVNRLPVHIQGKWRHAAVKELDSSGRYPNFTKLVEFLEVAAREINDPVFGCSDEGWRETKGKQSSNKTVRQSSSASASFGTEARNEQVKVGSTVNYGAAGKYPGSQVECYACSGNHQLSQCNQFKKMMPERRLEVVKDKRLCYNCLTSRNHVSRRCYRPAACNVPGCGLKHARLLHEALVRQPGADVTGNNEGHVQTVGAQSCACLPVDGEAAKVALPVVSVTVKAQGARSGIRTYALLDPGSNKSFCSMKLVNQLGLKGSSTSLALATLNKDVAVEAVEVSLEVMSARRSISLPKVYALQEFPALTGSIASTSDIMKWKHLRGISVPRTGNPEVGLLIGQDVPQALVPVELRRGQDGEPYAVRTPLGWTINGPLSSGGSSDNAVSNLIHAVPSVECSLEAQVEQFWRLDTGQLNLSQSHLSVDDKQVLEMWNKSVAVVDGHYELGIPFKTDPPELPDNRVMAERRLQSLKRRLLMNPDLLKQYTKEMEAVIKRGHAERIEDSDVEATHGRCWYLPHHCVINPNKPEKLRIVYDCAAKFEGTSLNERVFQGPDLTNKLLGVLLRFREGRIAIMGDIEAMFHQVRVTLKHRDALRFLWWTDGDLSRTPDVYRKTVHPFGGIWSPSCANFALRHTAEDYGAEFDPDAVQAIVDNFYADDCLKSVDTADKAIRLVQQLCQLLSKGGFRLTKWISNNRSVLDSIPDEEKAKELNCLNLDCESLPVERALGVAWNTEHDQFGITVKVKDKEFTKRGLLSVLSSVYDPLGIVCPFVLNAKKIFQDECRVTKTWDDSLSPFNCDRWKRWLKELPLLEEFQLERCIVPSEFGEVVQCELHHFSDASQDAYGAVSYIRLINSRGQIHCALMLARSRLSPMKSVTIPRLELMAAVVAVQLHCILSQELRLNVHRSVFWTDSMIVLQYIKNRARRFHTFVANRVAIVHDSSSPEQWRYVNSEFNPADDVSRGLSASDLVNSVRWRSGPAFLLMKEAEWPRLPETVPDLLVKDSEVKQLAKSCAAESSVQEDSVNLLFERHSDWFRLTKSVAWLRRFVTWITSCRLRNAAFSYRDQTDIKTLSVCELKGAELAIIRYLQNRKFASELRCLQSGGVVPRSSSIHRLDPYMDSDGILRVCGRLQSASISDEAKHPAILPKDSHATKLVVRHVHEAEACHSGREYVLACLRRKYWIPGARTIINKVLRECITCKRIRASPVNQRMSDLPMNRVVPGKAAFVNVGVDCFGPFQVKRGRSYEKRYGCLFTCLAIRAIHIEKLQSMESDAFINALVRFISRRGVPESIRSDNATNFVGSDKELRSSVEAWNKNSELRKFLLLKQIDWKYNTPAASHHGGVWERQIRTVRKVLNVILKDQTLDDDRLDTVFCEVEVIVNGRPLTVIPDSPDDFEALTPNHLLMLRSGSSGPLAACSKKDAYVRRWKHVQYLADMFWRRWLHEYLPTLQLRQKWLNKKRNIDVGDLVLVVNENTPRKCWPFARVIQVFPGKDGLVRSAQVKTPWNILTRPVSKLCLLEGASSD